MAVVKLHQLTLASHNSSAYASDTIMSIIKGAFCDYGENKFVVQKLYKHIMRRIHNALISFVIYDNFLRNTRYDEMVVYVHSMYVTILKDMTPPDDLKQQIDEWAAYDERYSVISGVGSFFNHVMCVISGLTTMERHLNGELVDIYVNAREIANFAIEENAVLNPDKFKHMNDLPEQVKLYSVNRDGCITWHE